MLAGSIFENENSIIRICGNYLALTHFNFFLLSTFSFFELILIGQGIVITYLMIYDSFEWVVFYFILFDLENSVFERSHYYGATNGISLFKDRTLGSLKL
jgi:hypothetical protein